MGTVQPFFSCTLIFLLTCIAVSQNDVCHNDPFEVIETPSMESAFPKDGSMEKNHCETSSAACNQDDLVSKPKEGFLKKFNYIVRRIFHSKL